MSDTTPSKTLRGGEISGGRDVSFIFLLNRAQKITTAIYLISGLFNENEPLRHELRRKAVELLSDIRTLSDNATANDQSIRTIRNVLEYILSMTDVGMRAGLVSAMNHDFLKAEIEGFLRDLMGTVQKGGEGALLHQSLKDISAPQTLPKILLPKKTATIRKGHDKGQPIGRIGQEVQPVFGDFKRMTGPIKDIIPVTPNNPDRKEKIYQIIQEKGELTIKDIAQVAPEYSEKTIQRDLVDMVSNGKLKKKGERRWTVYYI